MAGIDRDLLLVALAMFAGTGVAYGEMWTCCAVKVISPVGIVFALLI